ENAGIAMVQRAHGIEGMGRVARTGLHGSLCDRQLSIGVSDADANILPRSFGDDFHCAGKLRSDRDHSNVPACSLPEALEDFDARQRQIFRRMYSSTLVAEKWTFQMDAEWPSLHRVAAGNTSD